MLNYRHHFIRDYSTISEPLRKLTKKHQPFIWGESQQKAFETLKKCVTSADVLAFYNPKAETELIVVASPYGLGAILSQQQSDGTYKPVSYGSQALSDVESRYSQTDREARRHQPAAR